MKMVAILAMAVLLQACSVLDVLKAVIPGTTPGVSVEAQIGDRENTLGDSNEMTIKGDSATVTTNKADTQFRGDVKTDSVTITNMPTFLVWLLFAFALSGWILPRPQTLMKMWMEKKNGNV